MGIIKLLDDNTINKIAAGEVIEKPASIVKELVENSMDAGATEISVEVKGGGISFIRVTDNGKGIESSDIATAFLRHATSKLSDSAELNRIITLGFRGEALASIAAVSKVEMLSRPKAAELGNKVCVEGGTLIEKEQCGCPQGTIITVKDVFFNTPARLKFLKSESREGMYITDIMQNLALSHVNISFKYRLNEKLIFATKGDGDLKSVLLGIYGKQVVNNIIEVNCVKDFVTLKGFIGNSNIAKGNRNHQSTFVNGRYIKNKTVTAAVEAAYKSMITINKFPFFVLHIYINPELIDVNVHPAKAEIKLQDEQSVFKSVYHCVKDALIGLSSIPEVQSAKSNIDFSAIEKINYSQEQMKIQDNTGYESPRPSFYEEKIKETFEEDSAVSKPNYQEKNIFQSPYITKEEPERENAVKNKVPKFGPLAVVGQIHFTYIVAEGSDEMFLIDQHAAHERVYYEKYMNEFNSSSIHSQNMLTPVVFEFSASEKSIILENVEQFKKLGYEIEDFGGTSLSLRLVPLIYGAPDPKEMFYEITEQLDFNNRDILHTIDKVIYTMACKSAVKANDKLSYREMVELIDQLRFCDNPFTCPHGRPTIIKMSYQELEKKFKRIQ